MSPSLSISRVMRSINRAMTGSTFWQAQQASEASFASPEHKFKEKLRARSSETGAESSGTIFFSSSAHGAKHVLTGARHSQIAIAE